MNKKNEADKHVRLDITLPPNIARGIEKFCKPYGGKSGFIANACIAKIKDCEGR